MVRCFLSKLINMFATLFLYYSILSWLSFWHVIQSIRFGRVADYGLDFRRFTLYFSREWLNSCLSKANDTEIFTAMLGEFGNQKSTMDWNYRASTMVHGASHWAQEYLIEYTGLRNIANWFMLFFWFSFCESQ